MKYSTPPGFRTLQGFRNFLRRVMQEGPNGKAWHTEFNDWLRWIEGAVAAGQLRQEEAHFAWREEIPDAVSVHTCQGYVYSKPKGYDGDFEIMERIYQRWRSPNPILAKWDDYFHDQAAPKAVINRKQYFLDWLATKERKSSGNELRVLNVGSGPAREVFDYFNAYPKSRARIECVEQDTEAIAHAKALCKEFGDRIRFHHANAIRFRPCQQYDFIWSAGFFDYLNDKLFVCVLRRFWKMVEPGGELTLGNFSTANPTRTYMELGRWFLFHRTESQLLDLAVRAGIPMSVARVATEPAGVNLFLHLEKPQIT